MKQLTIIHKERTTMKIPKLSNYQKYYWAHPEHCRQLQRAKYERYPKRIVELNKNWQEKNKDYFRCLVNLGVKIRYHRLKKHMKIVGRLIKQREMLKEQHKLLSKKV